VPTFPCYAGIRIDRLKRGGRHARGETVSHRGDGRADRGDPPASRASCGRVRRVASSSGTYLLERFSEFARGGHFAALELPDLFVGDVAAFVRRVSDLRCG
jgi:hypothetical protein